MNGKHTYRLPPFSFAITRQGFLFLAAVILLSLAALHTANNLLDAVIATMLATVVVSSIASRNGLKQITLSLQVPENVFAGERVSVKITVRNSSRFLPSFSLLVEAMSGRKRRSVLGMLRKLFGTRSADDPESVSPVLDDFNPSSYFPVLRPGETRSQLVVQSFPNRGIFRIEGFRVSTRYPFGLLRRSEQIDVDGEVVVYPSLKNVSVYLDRLSFLPGLAAGSQKGQGETLFSIRPYQEGENARVIDWKATAKTGGLMGREFSREEESRFCLILDTWIPDKNPAKHGKPFEDAVSLAAGIASHFIDRDAELEFLSPRCHIPRGTGREHLYRILRYLALVRQEAVPPGSTSENTGETWHERSFPGIRDGRALRQILSDKVFKILITARPEESFPPAIRHASHLISFNKS
jgi:uncharacterized protein (DUF58 family)